MADPRFFHNAGPFRLEQIAEWTGAKLDADGKMSVKDMASLDKATGSDISFLDNAKYADALKTTKAGACFVHPKNAGNVPKGTQALVTDDPYRAYALTAQKFYPDALKPCVKSTDVAIAKSVAIGKNCTVGYGAVIGERVEIGEGSVIGAGVVIYDGVVIGKNTSIGANSTLSHCLIGDNVIIHRGVHIGQDGFGFAMGAKGHLKVPQLGRVIIENNVEIGSGTCIDRGANPDTVISEGTKIDNLVQIGHNVTIGKHSVIVSQVGISGSTHVGSFVVLAGQVGVAGHLRIADNVQVAAQSGVTKDLTESGVYGGMPAVPIKQWRRQMASLALLAKRKGADNDG